MSSRRFAVLLAVLGLLGVALLLWPVRQPSPAPPPAQAVVAARPPAPATPAPLQPHPHPQAAPLAQRINAPDTDPEGDVMALHQLLKLYQRALNGRPGTPIGDDKDLARALTGRNPMHQVFLPPGHPALSADGHLRDRWGTPYFLHPRGNGAFEVRSAGPDKKLFTADDVVVNPGPEQRGSPP